MKYRTKYALVATMLGLCLLTSCNNKQTSEPPLPDSDQTEENGPTATPSNMATYDIHNQIVSQLSGEVGTQFEYLTQHLTDTGYYLQQVHHGCFTQTSGGELLVTYGLNNPPNNLASDITFLFILDVYTGRLLTSHMISADDVEIFLLPSPTTTKIFVTETTAQISSATIYSCNSGNWFPTSALTDFSTLPLSEGNPDAPQDYVFTFNGDTLTVEQQEEGALSLFGIFRWNSSLSTFETA